MANKRRKGRVNGISIHRVYNVEELAHAMEVSAVTVRRWLNAGLPAVRDKRPLLILGGDVVDFKQASKASGPRCLPNECHCVKCHVNRVPDGNLAEFVPLTATTGNLSGFCPECGILMFKAMSKSDLPYLERLLDLTIREATPTIRERT